METIKYRNMCLSWIWENSWGMSKNISFNSSNILECLSLKAINTKLKPINLLSVTVVWVWNNKIVVYHIK